ncbi:GGDEF domain-containing protein [Shewanella woodyi]|uniref:diguanylate cyclase n=1 Tax=Shewanella woodyi (strain ATCC 51908 / MS32) TaxID=392500 RepID=B1KM74_SHEWM|nr:GGDEF domain-containing protein [Shewanella woodyi]ACA84487.1 diguanylate cyclase [Shewanella woodyi ATCC 51908]
MSAFYHRCRFLFLPLFVTALSLAIFQFSQPRLNAWHETIAQLPFWLLSISILIAIQFNRSRLAYLAALLQAYYLFTSSAQFTIEGLDNYSEQLLLGGVFTITWFAFIKDRGLLSPHSLIRTLGIILSFSAAFGWQWANVTFDNDLKLYLPEFITIEIRTLILLSLCTLLVFLRGLWLSNLVSTAIVITLLLWGVNFLLPNYLPSAVSLSMLAIIYLLTVLADSYFLAYRDELTGLASRRALYNLVLSLGRKYTVAMLDIDHFKKFNDTYGHDVGDQVLKLVASKIAEVTGGGKAFRYGGEEFTIVFSRKDLSSVLPHLEKVRKEIEKYDIVLRDEKRKKQTKAKRNKAQERNSKRVVNVTISIGVADHQHRESFEQTMKEADKALYRAKKKGRNQLSE